MLTSYAQVGIGTKTPDPAAVLDINAQILPGRYGGMKLPTVTLAQRASIATPIPDGLMIYLMDGNNRCVQLYDAIQDLWINWYCMNELPEASAVDFTGTLEVAQTLTASYTYSDGENDTESGTTFQWYRATDAVGTGVTPIAGASNATYTTTTSDGNFFIAVGVTPRAGSGASPGVEVLSAYKQISFQQTIVTFDLATTGVPEDDIRTVTINVTNPSATVATTVAVNIDAVNSTIGTLGTAYDIDYNSAAITGYPFVVTIPAGATTATFDFFAFADDDNAIDEVLTLALQNVAGGTNAVLGTQTTHTLTVIDDDIATAVAFTTTSSSVNEPVAVGNDSIIAVGITNPSATTATTVEISLNPSSTAESGDYTVTYGGSPVSFPFTVTFPAGQSTNESFTITAVDDADTDNETLVLDLASPAGGVAVAAVGVNNAHTLTINDDEVPAGPVLLAIQDFEPTPATPTLNYTVNSAGVFRTSNGSFPNSPAFIGTRSYGVNNGTADLDFGPVNTNGYASATLRFRLASFSSTSGNGADATDFVQVYISDDNGNTFSYELEITGFNNSRYDFNSTGSYSLPYDGNNIKTTVASSSSLAYSTIELTGLPITSNLVVGMVIRNNDSNELWVIDNVELYGNP